MLLVPPARFALPGSVGLCNAVRRTLLSDVRTEAPASVRVVRNVTCLTDEFLAHRVGLVPFRRVGNGDTLSLDVVGPRVVTAADLVGPAFDPVFPSIALAELRAGTRSRSSSPSTNDPRPRTRATRRASPSACDPSVRTATFSSLPATTTAPPRRSSTRRSRTSTRASTARSRRCPTKRRSGRRTSRRWRPSGRRTARAACAARGCAGASWSRRGSWGPRARRGMSSGRSSGCRCTVPCA